MKADFLPADGFYFPLLLHISALEGLFEMRCSFGLFSSFTVLVWFANWVQALKRFVWILGLLLKLVKQPLLLGRSQALTEVLQCQWLLILHLEGAKSISPVLRAQACGSGTECASWPILSLQTSVSRTLSSHGPDWRVRIQEKNFTSNIWSCLQKLNCAFQCHFKHLNLLAFAKLLWMSSRGLWINIFY